MRSFLGFFLLVTACSGASAESTVPAPSAGEPADDQADTSGQANAPKEPSAPAVDPKAPGSSNNPTTPSALTCLAGHYVGSPTSSALLLPDGTSLPWNDGAVKTYDQKLENTDLEDVLSIPYTTGAITPVSTPNLDPGRLRNDALLKATFGSTAALVGAALVSVDFVGQTVKFHTRAAAALGKVSTKLSALIAQTPSLAAFVTGELGGTFEWRPILNTNRMSAHSYGIAIDIVVSKSDYWEWDKKPDGSFTWTNRIPQAIVDAFESEGFAWGGRWNHYDTMHFEYRPELFDKACAL